MNAKKNKKVLMLTTVSLAAVAMSFALVGISGNSGLLSQRSTAADVLSVRFDSSSDVIGGSVQSTSCLLASSLEKSGLRVKASIFNSVAPSSTDVGVISRFAGETASVDFSIDDPNNKDVTKFQAIASISFEYLEGSYSGNFKVMWSNDNSYWETILVNSGASSQSLPLGAHYVRVINNTNTSDGALGYAKFTSFTINYSCSANPDLHEHSISYYGLDDEEISGVAPASLVYTAEAGQHVVIEPYFLPTYVFYDAFETHGSYITDFVVSNTGVIQFTMPDHEISIEIDVEVLSVELESISISGNTKTTFDVGDSFDFDGTVTATYTDESEVDVTDDVEFSEPDMSQAGVQTVTVSYTDGGITKTAEYTISITSPSGPTEVKLSGTYSYSSREKSGSGYSSWPNMKITFKNDGTATWENHRTNYMGEINCECYFTYIASDNGANITINMALTGYYFERAGAEWDSASAWSGYGYDKPVDASFTSSSAKNNSGVMKTDRSSLSINVYDSSHSFELYDTLTFSLVA